MPRCSPSIFLSAGEASGEHYGAAIATSTGPLSARGIQDIVNTMMFDPKQVQRAFAWRKMPLIISRAMSPLQFRSTDEEDALFFQARDWRDITWDHWDEYFRGLFFFTPEALAYYMPSIMLLSLEKHRERMLAIDSLLIRLQRGVNCIADHSHVTQDLLWLTKEECLALAEWLMYLRSLPEYEVGTNRVRIDEISTALQNEDFDERFKLRE